MKTTAMLSAVFLSTSVSAFAPRALSKVGPSSSAINARAFSRATSALMANPKGGCIFLYVKRQK